SREYDIPEAISDLRPLVQLQFQSWQGPYEIDDLKVEPLGDKLPPPPEPKPKVTVTVKERPLETGFSPVERIFPLKWENRNGLFYRNGRPYFFCGTGQYGGGGMEGAAGLWLSRLQGLRFIGTYDETPSPTTTSPSSIPKRSSRRTGRESFPWRRRDGEHCMVVVVNCQKGVSGGVV
ncbi:MAG TPA: hypothetical protein PLG21_07675, partial [Anaerolineae bacterium]|nr:hypothetical protein [Anaerolineae bacterium]